MRQSTVAPGRISAFLAHTVHTWKFGVLFPSGLVSGSHTCCVWVLPVEYRNLNSPAILWFFAQCLDRQWIHVLHQYLALFDAAVKWTRILRWCFFVTMKGRELGAHHTGDELNLSRRPPLHDLALWTYTRSRRTQKQQPQQQ